MPNISAAKLRELEEDRDKALAFNAELLESRKILRGKLDRFDDILGEIEKAATGQPLGDNRGAGLNYDSVYSGRNEMRLTDEERRELEMDRLRNLITTLECRLSAVIAVAQFARWHKL